MTIRLMGLDTVELVMALEEEFRCEISGPDAEKMNRVRDVLDWLERMQEEGRLFRHP